MKQLKRLKCKFKYMKGSVRFRRLNRTLLNLSLIKISIMNNTITDYHLDRIDALKRAAGFEASEMPVQTLHAVDSVKLLKNLKSVKELLASIESKGLSASKWELFEALSQINKSINELS